MPAKWQKWMPLHIDRFMGSRYVQAMHPSARAGYLYLIAAQWQSDDCTLSSDPEELAALSGLGDTWADFSRVILRHFTSVDDRLRNDVCFEEWSEALRVFEARRKGAKTANERSADAERADSERTAVRLAHTQTVTVTETDIEKQILLASSPSGNSAETPFVELPTNRRNLHFPVYESHILDWIALYPAVDARQQVRNMRGWLDGNPEHRKTLKGTPAFIHRWLSKAQDKGGSVGTQPGSNGSRGLISPASQRVESGVNAFRQAGERLGITAARGVDGADGSPLSPPGHRAGSGELSVRHAALAGEVRVQGGGDSTPDFAHKAQPEILPPPDRSSTGVRSYGS